MKISEWYNKLYPVLKEQHKEEHGINELQWNELSPAMFGDDVDIETEEEAKEWLIKNAIPMDIINSPDAGSVDIQDENK